MWSRGVVSLVLNAAIVDLFHRDFDAMICPRAWSRFSENSGLTESDFKKCLGATIAETPDRSWSYRWASHLDCGWTNVYVFARNAFFAAGYRPKGQS